MQAATALPAIGPRRFALLFAALFAAAAVPVLICDTLPLFDYPNHLARMHILADLTRSPELQRFYTIQWRPVPNLAMDAIVPALAHIMPLDWAGKAFVLATLLLLAGGTALLQRVLFSTWSAWPCLAFLLLYSRILLWGFLNYLFGLGLALCAVAGWIALRQRSPPLRLAIGMVAALALFFAHLLAFGLYGVLVMGYEAGEALRQRPGWLRAAAALALAGAAFVPALLILFGATPGALGGAVRYGHPLRKLDLMFSVFDNYSRPFDVACFAVVVLALIFLFARRWVRLAPAITVPLALLLVVYLVMPSQLATASGADHRIPLLLGLVLVAGSDWAAPRARARRIVLVAALALFAVRLAVVTAVWRDSDRLYARLLPALDGLPPGSRVAVAYPPEALNSEATPLAHFPTLAIVRRDAFVPTLFAFATQQPVVLRPEYRALADRLTPERLWAGLVAAAPPLDESERAAIGGYDYVAVVGRHPFRLPVQPWLAAVFAGPRFALCRVMADAARLDGAAPPR
ncbi:MAG TPA: hypothetical protein VN681_15550 [Stellaceae bacterium]|nr:hypothetical protein [Stellaceae bacterium]